MAGVGLGVVVAYVGIVIASLPLGLFAFALASHRPSFGVALRQVTTGLAAAGLVGLAAFAVTVDPSVALLVGGALLAEALVFVGFPLLIGRQLIGRWTGISSDQCLEFATLGLPGALVVSAVVLVVPGGSNGSNITFLEGPAAVLAWVAFLTVITFGPAVLGVGFARLFAAVE